ncbi:twin-arginine translocation signal domain-containing protein, partial [Natronobacterium gregoryi]
MGRTTQSLDVDRRGVLKASGVAALAAGVGGRTLVQESSPATDDELEEGEEVKTICSHCSVGCGLKMVVDNDAVVGQEPWDDHPINEGGLCAKGASLAQTVNSDRRLKEPMKRGCHRTSS